MPALGAAPRGVVKIDWDHVPAHTAKGRLTGKVRVYPQGVVSSFSGVLNVYRIVGGEIVYRPPSSQFTANPARSTVVTWSVPCYRIGRLQPWRLGVAIYATGPGGSRSGASFGPLFSAGCR